MKQSTLSMIVFAIYLFVTGILFLIAPNPFITLLGFEPVDDVWIRTFGLVMFILGFYYIMAIKEEAYNFYRWTSYGRFPVFFVLLSFVALDLAPSVLLLIGAFESGCGIWTGLALKKENAI